MTEIEIKRLISVLSWITKYNKVPKMVINDKDYIPCSGSVSSSHIRVSIGNISVEVDKEHKFGTLSDPGRIYYATTNTGDRFQCNLIGDEIIEGLLLGGSRIIKSDITYDHVISELYGSTTLFKFE